MEEYIKYSDELNVKATLYQSYENLEEELQIYGNEIYNIDYLKALRRIILNNSESLFIYEDMRSYINKVIDCLYENVIYFDLLNMNKWDKEIIVITRLLNDVEVSDKYDFFELEYIKRTATNPKKDVLNEETFLMDAILADILMIDCLYPSINNNFDIYKVDKEIDGLYKIDEIEIMFIGSMNKFHFERPNLFDNIYAKNSVIRNLEKIEYPNLKMLNGHSSEYYLKCSADSKRLLNRLR